MTDASTAPLTRYPDTTVGILMRERDSATTTASTARKEAEQLTAEAVVAEARVAALVLAIERLGGEEPMLPSLDPPRGQIVVFPDDVIEDGDTPSAEGDQ